jgi:hypothetical protein
MTLEVDGALGWRYNTHIATKETLWDRGYSKTFELDACFT